MTLEDGSYLKVPRTGIYHVYAQLGLVTHHSPTPGFNIARICNGSRTDVLETFETAFTSRRNHLSYPFLAGTFWMERGCGFAITINTFKFGRQLQFSHEVSQTFLGAFLVH